MALKSRNDVLWFCLVLLVEVFGLSVALGGPWIEVSYFLSVVASQTVAGAYIWAHLRKHEQQLPIPEILAMGFAIGSSSAAISQLILRDLLGIRLMISPFVPIIAVAIWLLVKRSPRLGVEITHTDSTTLLWLLFPAPLAIGFYIWEVFVFFVFPLIAFLFFKGSCKSKYRAVSAILLSNLILGFLIRLIQSYPAAILILGGVDEIYDESLAIGFSNWGISENIGLSGGSFNYYKLSHLWLGPLLEITNSPAMTVTTTIATLSIYSFIGMAIWTLTCRICGKAWVCGLGSIFLFISKSSPESIDLPLRLAQTLSFLFFLTGIYFIQTQWRSKFVEFVGVATILFVIFSTRVQYGLIAAVGYMIYTSRQLLFHEKKTSEWCLGFISTALPFLLCYQIFFSYSSAPKVTNDSFEFAATTWRLLGSLSGLLMIQIISYKYWAKKISQVYIFQIAALVLSFALPNGTIGVEPLLVTSLMAFFSVAPNLIFLNLEMHLPRLILFLSTSFSLGFAIRIFYDLYKWTEIDNLNSVIRFWFLVTSSAQTSGFFACVAIVLLAIGLKGVIPDGRNIRFSSILLVVFFGLSVGIGSATIIRPLSNAIRYDWSVAASIESDSQLSWYTNVSKREALSEFKRFSNIDDIFAHNTSNLENYRNAAPIISGITHRRAYIEGQYVGMELFAEPTTFQRKRLLFSINFAENPSSFYLAGLREDGVNWFIIDLERTELRDWEPWATTRYMNDKVAILELATDIEG